LQGPFKSSILLWYLDRDFDNAHKDKLFYYMKDLLSL